MVTVGILIHNEGKLVRIMIKVNPQDVEVDSPNQKFKVYVPHSFDGFYPILFNTTNTILKNFGPKLLHKGSRIVSFSLFFAGSLYPPGPT